MGDFTPIFLILLIIIPNLPQAKPDLAYNQTRHHFVVKELNILNHIKFSVLWKKEVKMNSRNK